MDRRSPEGPPDPGHHPPAPDLPELEQLLRRRLEVIADHQWRDRDPEAHLAALGSVSAAIESWHRRHDSGLPARLRHFLANASYDKALALITSTPTVERP